MHWRLRGILWSCCKSSHQQPGVREGSPDVAASPNKEEPAAQLRSPLQASDVSVFDSDKSGASIFGLRNMVHLVTRSDDESEGSQDQEAERAGEERRTFAVWRKTNLVERDEDFAFFYSSFQEAYMALFAVLAASVARTASLVAAVGHRMHTRPPERILP